jgi:hypothetical protein
MILRYVLYTARRLYPVHCGTYAVISYWADSLHWVTASHKIATRTRLAAVYTGPGGIRSFVPKNERAATRLREALDAAFSATHEPNSRLSRRMKSCVIKFQVARNLVADFSVGEIFMLASLILVL